MTTTEILRKSHAIVWQRREELKDVWKIPSVEDCLLFSFCELGEAIDAHLRTKPEYSRNNAKDLSVLDELADCAMMLLTALGEEDQLDDVNNVCAPWMHGWSSLIDEMRDLIFWHGNIYFPDQWIEHAIGLLEAIATYPGMDLPARLVSRLDRIERRVLGQVKVEA